MQHSHMNVHMYTSIIAQRLFSKIEFECLFFQRNDGSHDECVKISHALTCTHTYTQFHSFTHSRIHTHTHTQRITLNTLIIHPIRYGMNRFICVCTFIMCVPCQGAAQPSINVLNVCVHRITRTLLSIRRLHLSNALPIQDSIEQNTIKPHQIAVTSI